MPRRKQDSLIPSGCTDSEYVAHVIEQLGITQGGLSRLLGLSEGQVCKLVGGVHKVHPTVVRVLGLICEVPGVLTWLITAQEILHGPITEGAKPKPYRPPSNKEVAPWPDEP